MRNITLSGPKSSVCTGVGVTLLALIAGAFDLYSPHDRFGTSGAVTSQPEMARITAIDRGARET